MGIELDPGGNMSVRHGAELLPGGAQPWSAILRHRTRLDALAAAWRGDGGGFLRVFRLGLDHFDRSVVIGFLTCWAVCPIATAGAGSTRFSMSLTGNMLLVQKNSLCPVEANPPT